MNKTKALNMLGLAMRAGKLVTGEEMTLKEIRNEKAAWSLSPVMLVKIQKKIKDKVLITKFRPRCIFC